MYSYSSVIMRLAVINGISYRSNLRCIKYTYLYKVRSLSRVGLCFQLQKRKCCNGSSPELLLKIFAWIRSIKCTISHTPHLLSPPSQMKRVPAHMPGWLTAGPGDLGPHREHPSRCIKCYIVFLQVEDMFNHHSDYTVCTYLSTNYH